MRNVVEKNACCGKLPPENPISQHHTNEVCIFAPWMGFPSPAMSKTATMLIQRFKSKIHRATVTQADLNYVGSITIDEDLMDAARLVEGERVQIVNNNNGARLETYVITGERGSGVICLNGAAARRVAVGDIVIIIAYGYMTEEEARAFQPVTVFPDEYNRIPSSHKH